MTGKIARIVPSERGSGGYGFISAADGVEYYFNASGLQLSSVRFEYLNENDDCRFTPIDHPHGPRAIEVFVADPNQQPLF